MTLGGNGHGLFIRFRSLQSSLEGAGTKRKGPKLESVSPVLKKPSHNKNWGPAILFFLTQKFILTHKNKLPDLEISREPKETDAGPL